MYLAKSNSETLKKEDLEEMLKAETFLTADECDMYGFAKKCKPEMETETEDADREMKPGKQNEEMVMKSAVTVLNKKRFEKEIQRVHQRMKLLQMKKRINTIKSNFKQRKVN